MITFQLLDASHPRWEALARYAEKSAWQAGPALARAMRNGDFSDWERVIAALDEGAICGYCTVTKEDCIPNVPYTPYVGFVFVEEGHRGQRLSQRMIQFAMDYLKQAGFSRVYLTSDHENLYEKYGFSVVDRKRATWGAEEKIYMRTI